MLTITGFSSMHETLGPTEPDKEAIPDIDWPGTLFRTLFPPLP